MLVLLNGGHNEQAQDGGLHWGENLKKKSEEEQPLCAEFLTANQLSEELASASIQGQARLAWLKRTSTSAPAPDSSPLSLLYT